MADDVRAFDLEMKKRTKPFTDWCASQRMSVRRRYGEQHFTTEWARLMCAAWDASNAHANESTREGFMALAAMYGRAVQERDALQAKVDELLEARAASEGETP